MVAQARKRKRKVRGTNVELSFVELESDVSLEQTATLLPAPDEETDSAELGADDVGGDAAAPDERPSDVVAAIVRAVDRRLDERFHGDYRWVERMGGPEKVAARMIEAVPTVWIEGFPYGGFYTSAGLAKWKGVSRQAVHQWGKRGRVFSVKRGNRLLNPAFQFSGRGEPLPDVQEVILLLLARGLSDWGVIEWLARPSVELDGDSPAHRLRTGATQQVLEQAKRDPSIPVAPADDQAHPDGPPVKGTPDEPGAARCGA